MTDVQDHFGGIELLDDALPIVNFYAVKNQATKDEDTESFKRYCSLRDSDKAFYLQKHCTREWLNLNDEERQGAGIQILGRIWPMKPFRYSKVSHGHRIG